MTRTSTVLHQNVILLFAILWSGAALTENVNAAADAAQKGLADLPVLGQDLDGVTKRCGQPLHEQNLPSGIRSMSFTVGAFRVIVEIAPTTKKVVQIYHFRKTPFTEKEIAQLLKQNSQGLPWRAEDKPALRWKRSDGALSRGSGPTLYENQNAEEWKFVVLDPNWRPRP